MDFRLMGFDAPLIHTLHNMLDSDDSDANRSVSAPTRTYVRDDRAMAATPCRCQGVP
ncbi:hypothetical protein OROMI_031066 [Orobanche minor]